MFRAVLLTAIALTTANTAGAAPNLKGDPRFPGAEAFGRVWLTDERMPSAEYVIAPNGAEIIFFGYNRGYSVFDVAQGKIAASYKDHPSFRDITFSPDGKFMATAEWWDGVKIRDPKTGAVLRTLKPDGELGAFYAAFLPNGKLAAYCWRSEAGQGSPMKEQLALWDPATWKTEQREVIERTEGRELTRRWFVGPDRHLLSMTRKTNDRGAEVSRSCTLTDPNTNKESARVVLDTEDFVCDASPGGHSILVSNRKGDTRLIDVASGKVTANLKGHKQMVTCGAFAPDGKRVVTASGSRTRSNPSHWATMKGETEMILWDASTGKELAAMRDTKQMRDYHQIKFSPDGKYVAATTPPESPGKGQRHGGELILWGQFPLSSADTLPAKKSAESFALADRLEKFIEELATSSRSANEKAEALFLVVLGRFPTPDEKERAAALCKDAAGVRRCSEVLIDTKEFREHAEGLSKRLGGK